MKRFHSGQIGASLGRTIPNHRRRGWGSLAHPRLLLPDESGGPGSRRCFIAASKLLSALFFGFGLLCDFSASDFSTCLHWPLNATLPTLSSHVATWDGAHYLFLAQQGYRSGSSSCAFYPLWPMVIRLAAAMAHISPLLAALALANALSVAVFTFFQRAGDAQAQCGPVITRNALLLFLAFPGAVFFSFPYTESLYLALVFVWFLGIQREAYLWPALAAFLLPLTRPVGVFMLVPFAWHLFEKRKPRRYWLLLLAPLGGWAAYFGLMGLWTGNPFEGFAAQKNYPNAPSISNMFHLGNFFQSFLNVGSLDGMLDSVLDRFCFLLFLAALPFIWRLDRTWFWYALPVGLVPAMTSYFMSYRRYIMACFPVFFVVAQLLARTGRRWVFWYYVVLMALLHAWAVVQFVNFNWAG